MLAKYTKYQKLQAIPTKQTSSAVKTEAIQTVLDLLDKKTN